METNSCATPHPPLSSVLIGMIGRCLIFMILHLLIVMLGIAFLFEFLDIPEQGFGQVFLVVSILFSSFLASIVPLAASGRWPCAVGAVFLGVLPAIGFGGGFSPQEYLMLMLGFLAAWTGGLLGDRRTEKKERQDQSSADAPTPERSPEDPPAAPPGDPDRQP